VICDAVAVIDVEELFPGREAPDEAMQAAIAAVCVRLGRAVDVVRDGQVSTVVAGAIDGERVAWVEQRWRDAGYEDIDGYELYVDGAGSRMWEIDTYNPWFGCTIHFMRWYGDDLVVIYSEKHHTIVCVLDQGGAPRMRVVHGRWQVVGDLVLYASEARGLVERIHLPDLGVCAPLPADEAAIDLTAGTCEPAAPLVAGTPAFWRQVALRLPEVDEVLAELLIGSLAYRFWEERPPVASTYEEAYAAASGRWNPPCWLPFHWLRTRGMAEAKALLAELEAVAARAPTACNFAEAPAELAARHIAARAGELAAACRAGRLPEGTSCSFWIEWSQVEFAAAKPRFPVAMWSEYQQLRKSAPELLALVRR